MSGGKPTEKGSELECFSDKTKKTVAEVFCNQRA
jgi:hypothetical protein